MEAWGYAIAFVVGGLLTGGATILATELRARREKEERQRDREEAYRRLVSEKLLEKQLWAYQKGFSYCRRLRDMIVTYEGMDTLFPVKDSNEIFGLALEARDWYNSNCLYLDEVSRKEMLSAVNGVQAYILQACDVIKAMEKLSTASEAIESGIGMKHIEEPRKE